MGTWAIENAIWIIPAVWGAVEAYRRAKGTIAEKSWEAAKELHELTKQHYQEKYERKIAESIAKLGGEAKETEKLLPEWNKKLSDADAMLLSRRPGATKEEVARGNALREKYGAKE